jgi:hypothetical protein
VTAAETLVRRRPIDAIAWGIGVLVGFIVLVAVIAIVTILLAIVLAAAGLDSLAGLEFLFGVVAVMALSLAYAIAAFFLADAIVGLALARLVDRAGPDRTGPDPADAAEPPARPTARVVALLAIGAAVVVVVTALPVIGPLLKFAVVIVGSGALLAALWRWWRARPAQPAPTPPAALDAAG